MLLIFVGVIAACRVRRDRHLVGPVVLAVAYTLLLTWMDLKPMAMDHGIVHAPADAP